MNSDNLERVLSTNGSPKAQALLWTAIVDDIFRVEIYSEAGSEFVSVLCYTCAGRVWERCDTPPYLEFFSKMDLAEFESLANRRPELSRVQDRI